MIAPLPGHDAIDYKRDREIERREEDRAYANVRMAAYVATVLHEARFWRRESVCRPGRRDERRYGLSRGQRMAAKLAVKGLPWWLDRKRGDRVWRLVRVELRGIREREERRKVEA